jgi:hypothetical protein
MIMEAKPTQYAMIMEAKPTQYAVIMEAHDQVVSELEAHRTGDCTGEHRTDERSESAPLASTADDPRHDKIRELPSMLWRPIIKPSSGWRRTTAW